MSDPNLKSRPHLIVFDGIDGTGKTTQMKRLADRLAAEGIPVVITAEPTDSEDGKRLRRALSGREPASQSRLAALFLLDRIRHNEEIAAHLFEGKTVLCDRYYYSSLAYQGVGEAFDWVADMNLHCPAIRHPDGCIMLDLDPTVSMSRIRAGRSAEDLEIFETVAQQEEIRARFARVVAHIEGQAECRERIIRVNADGTREEVAGRVWEAYLSIVSES